MKESSKKRKDNVCRVREEKQFLLLEERKQGRAGISLAEIKISREMLESLSLSKYWNSGAQRNGNFPMLGFLLIWWNAMTKKQVWEEKIYLSYISTSLSSWKEVRAWTQTEQEAGGKSSCRGYRGGTTYWFAFPGLLCLIFYRLSTTSPGMTPPTIDWAVYSQLLIEKIP